MGLFDQATSQPQQGLMGLAQQPQNYLPYKTEAGEIFTPSVSNPTQNFDDFYKSPEYQKYQTNMQGGMGTSDIYNSPYFGYVGSGSMGRAQDNAYEQYLARSGTTTTNPTPLNSGMANSTEQNNKAIANPNFGGALKNILGGNFNSTPTQPTDYAQNDASLPQNIQEFLKKDRAGSVMDAGEGWSYDPTTQSFNSNTRGGSQTKSLAEMQNYVNGQGQTTALSPYPNAMQSAVAQTTANPMQQMNVGNQTQQIQQQNPVNTQTVQPNFMGQTPFGQPQTGQYTSTNPFVQAAQANAQGNLGGALQATSANRVN